MDDAQLLQSYVETGSSEAFTALTNKHVNFVYGAALRLVRDRHVAEEVTQAVFIVLARKAATLRHEAVLSSWLLSTTRYAALGQMKINARRKRHERRAAEMAKTEWHEDAEKSWPQYEGELDGALAALRETDRKAVLLRFYEHKSFDEIAAILGTAEEAARKRVSRAVEKLRGYFNVKNGTAGSRALSGTMLTYFLVNKLSIAAPSMNFANAVAGVALKPALASATVDQLAGHIGYHLAVVQVKWVATSVAAAVVLCVAGGAAVFSSLNPEHHPAPSHPTGPQPRDVLNR
jgi:RNA polymerase sigma factor (sigma-70 family)